MNREAFLFIDTQPQEIQRALLGPSNPLSGYQSSGASLLSTHKEVLRAGVSLPTAQGVDASTLSPCPGPSLFFANTQRFLLTKW